MQQVHLKGFLLTLLIAEDSLTQHLIKSTILPTCPAVNYGITHNIFSRKLKIFAKRKSPGHKYTHHRNPLIYILEHVEHALLYEQNDSVILIIRGKSWCINNFIKIKLWDFFPVSFKTTDYCFLLMW